MNSTIWAKSFPLTAYSRKQTKLIFRAKLFHFYDPCKKNMKIHHLVTLSK